MEQPARRRARCRRRARARLPAGPQRAGNGARSRRLRPAPRPARGVRLHGLGRPGLDEHGDRCCARDGQSDPRAAAARRRLRHPRGQPGSPRAGGPALVRRQRERLLEAGLAVLGPHQPSRAAAAVADGRNAGADRPRRDGCGHPRTAPGRAGRGLGLGRRPVRTAGLARHSAARRRRRSGTGELAHPGRRASAGRGRRRGDLQRGNRCATGVRRDDRRSGGRDTGRQRQPALRPPAVRGRNRRHRHDRGGRTCRGGRRRDRGGDPLQRLHDRVQDGLRRSGRALRQPQRRLLRCPQALSGGSAG
jgi:hypothetical protein